MYKLTDTQKEIIRKHQRNIPVNIIAIAMDFGINVFDAKYSNNSLSGKIVKDTVNGGESGYAIIVNKNDPPVRQRFTIAHEIAHFLLHKDCIGDGIVEDALYRSGLSNEKEVMANKLAADILMPMHLINVAIDESFKSISELANKFKVSETAMAIRLGIPS